MKKITITDHASPYSLFDCDISGDCAHLWCIRIPWQDQCLQEDRLVTSCFNMMSSQERLKAMAIQLDDKRNQAIIARGVLRKLLGRYLKLSPEAVSFEYGPHGKPRIAETLGQSVCFNVSHSSEWVVIICANEAVGVDVESSDREADCLAIAERFYHRQEAEWLKELPPEQQSEWFWRLWVAKEAYVKATGRGIALGLDRIAFAKSEDGSLQQQGSSQAIGAVEVHEFSVDDLAGSKRAYYGALAVSGRLRQVLRCTTNAATVIFES